MCGRYFLTTPGAVLAESFALESAPELPPRWNIAPTQNVPIVRAPAAVRGGPARELAMVRWGLVPFWAKEAAIGNRLINARAESLGEKPAFRDSFRKRRCLIPADGFYEWKKEGAGKQPWLLRLRGGGVLAFAGLWSRWQDPAGGAPLESCAIVTTTPNELAATVHDRMPVVLPFDRHGTWLDPEAAAPALAALLRPFPAEEMEAFPVSKLVNSPAHDEPGCIVPT
ncbi:MAG: SOS response-associated peptidase [Thermoanaerobaculia bacterium]|nr:MAG: SOS response-associated peptidase [Thermoanaerobaculia bacterium]